MGVPVFLTATLDGLIGSPTGTVTFLNGTQIIGQVAIVNGQATLLTGTLSVGTHIITAQYNGDGTFPAATSNPVTQVVIQTAAGTTIINKDSCGALGIEFIGVVGLLAMIRRRRRKQTAARD